MEVIKVLISPDWMEHTVVKDNINMSDLSKIVMVIVVVVVLHGQNCIINENWLYKPILKDTYIDLF